MSLSVWWACPNRSQRDPVLRPVKIRAQKHGDVDSEQGVWHRDRGRNSQKPGDHPSRGEIATTHQNAGRVGGGTGGPEIDHVDPLLPEQSSDLPSEPRSIGTVADL